MSGVRLGPGREFDVVRDFVRRWGETARGIGGDCAVLEVPAGESLCVSTDSSVEGVHFRAGWLAPREIGYRSTAGALSDLAAAAALPLGLVLALAVPERWRHRLGEIADGIADAARRVHCPILGGDTTAAPDALTLTVTVLGSAASPLGRAGARPGDRIFVTGALGGAIAALRAFERGDAPAPPYRDRFAYPHPRVVEGRWLAIRAAAHAAVDVSDGLVADLGHVAAASGVRIRVDLDAVPCLAGVAPELAAVSGEEYELAVALPPDDGVRGAFERETGTPLTEIGEVLATDAGSEGVDVFAHGARVDLPPGYDHFSA